MSTSKNSLQTIHEALPEATLPPMVGVGAIALQMAMDYHDTTIIKDGVMYQQMKMEGKNIGVLGLGDVFETAKLIEIHLMGTSDRIAGLVVETLQLVMANEDSITKMISDFVSEDIPQHPEPALLSEHYEVLDGVLDNTEKCLTALKNALGLSEYESGLYDNVIETMSDDDKSNLISKIKYCLRLDDFQNLIEDVVNKELEDLPDVQIVFDNYTNSIMTAEGVPSEVKIRETLLNCFLQESIVGTSEKDLFMKALSFYNEDDFYKPLKEIYLS
jgi:hypothetical protein